MKEYDEQLETEEFPDGAPDYVNNNTITDEEKKFLKFYDKLRKKLDGSNKTGMSGLTEYLFLLPDFFILLLRVYADKRVDKSIKLKVVAILAYVMMPLDFLPDFIPFVGYTDDLLLVVTGLNMILNQIGSNTLLDNWSGSYNMLEHIQKIINLAELFLDKNLFRKLERIIKKK